MLDFRRVGRGTKPNIIDGALPQPTKNCTFHSGTNKSSVSFFSHSKFDVGRSIALTPNRYKIDTYQKIMEASSNLDFNFQELGSQFDRIVEDP